MQTNVYVIGLSRTNLLHIEWSMNWSNGTAKVNSITHGVRYLEDATLIPGEKEAYETLQEIKENYENIVVICPNIVEACITGGGIDPEKLHIYEVNIGKEIY